MGNKFIDPCPNRRYDEVFKAGLKMMGDIQVPDQATRFRQAALSDPNDERDISPEWLQGKLNEAADVIETVQSELEQTQQWVHDLQSGMYINCVYCGHRYGPADEVPTTMADALKEHVEKCPKHPMSALKSELKRRDEQCQHCFQDDAELEAERGKVRELREVMKDALQHLDIMYSVGSNSHVSAKAVLQHALNNTTAPTEAEIRQSERERIADWLGDKAKQIKGDFSAEHESITVDSLANELRQRVDGGVG